jgi:hypothetical protein
MGGIARPDSALIRDAQVSIFDEVRNIPLTYNPSQKCYTVSNRIVNIQPAKEYKLQVKVGDIVCRASCQIPPNPGTPIINQSKQNDDFIAILTWPNSEKSRYFILNYSLKEVIFRPQIGNTTGPYTSFLTNSLFDRQKDEANELEIRVFNAFKADRVSLAISYQVLDENTYNYLKTYQDFNNWKINTEGFIPNLREPQPVFDNIEGGIGVFGGYNQWNWTLKIK